MLPITPKLKTELVRGFRSVFDLFDFYINVTIKTAAAAPVYPLAASSILGTCHFSSMPACHQQPLPSHHITSCQAVYHWQIQHPLLLADSVAHVPEVSKLPPPAAVSNKRRRLLDSMLKLNANTTAQYKAVRQHQLCGRICRLAAQPSQPCSLA